MKNQNDIIISASVMVVGIIVAIVIYSGSPTPTKPAEPTAVDTSDPKYPAGAVVFGNGTSTQAAGRGGGMGRGGMGGPGMGAPGMGGPGGAGGLSARMGAAGKMGK